MTEKQRAQEHFTDEQVDQFLADPRLHFGKPQRVLTTDGLSREQKIEILRSWATDSELLATASSESMTGGESNDLALVQKALESLDAVEVSDPT